jgi:hypothetical protein
MLRFKIITKMVTYKHNIFIAKINNDDLLANIIKESREVEMI